MLQWNEHNGSLCFKPCVTRWKPYLVLSGPEWMHTQDSDFSGEPIIITLLNRYNTKLIMAYLYTHRTIHLPTIIRASICSKWWLAQRYITVHRTEIMKLKNFQLSVDQEYLIPTQCKAHCRSRNLKSVGMVDDYKESFSGHSREAAHTIS